MFNKRLSSRDACNLRVRLTRASLLIVTTHNITRHTFLIFIVLDNFFFKQQVQKIDKIDLCVSRRFMFKRKMRNSLCKMQMNIFLIEKKFVQVDKNESVNNKLKCLGLFEFSRSHSNSSTVYTVWKLFISDSYSLNICAKRKEKKTVIFAGNWLLRKVNRV